MRYWTTGFIVIAASLLAWPAIAQPPSEDGERGERRGGPELRERIIKEFDKDGDGGLNEEERQAMRDAMRGRRGRSGPDGGSPRDERRREGAGDDQATSGEEAERGPEGRRGPDGERGGEGRRGPRGERRPGSGGPDDDRRPEGRRGPEGRGPDGDRGPEGRRGPIGPMGGPPDRVLEPLFSWFDADGDNLLSRYEFAELSQFVRRHHRPGPPRGPEGGPGRGPRIGRRGGDGPPSGGDFRGRPDRPRRAGEFRGRERGPAGGSRGDGAPRGDDEGRGRRDRDERGPRGDQSPRPDGPPGPSDRPQVPAEEAI